MALSDAQKAALASLQKESKIEPILLGRAIKSLPTGSIVLDSLSGCGGLPRGRFIEISGAESSGKSTLATAICGVAQSQGFKPVYLDVEQTFDTGYAKKLKFDLGPKEDPKAFLFQPQNIEEAIIIAEKFGAIQETGVIVLDSVASARTEGELEGSGQLGQHSKAVGDFCNRVSKVISLSEVILIGVNQNRTKMEKVGQNTVVTEDVAGGRTWKYTCTCRFGLRICGGERGEEWNPLTGKMEEVKISNRIRINTLKNKAGVPHRAGEFIIRFGEGIDNLSTVIELAEAYKVIEKSGNGYFKYDKSKKPANNFTCRGHDELRKKLLTNKDLVNELITGIGLDKILQNATPEPVVAPIVIPQADGQTGAAAGAA